MKTALSFVFAALLFSQCSKKEKEEELVKDINKDGSVETVIGTQLTDSAVILTTKHSIWKNKVKVKDIIYRDTLPVLGDTVYKVEDPSTNVTTTVNKKKDYKHFITVSGQ